MAAILQRYLIVWLSLLSLLAAMWPTWCSALPDPFLATEGIHLKILFGITMFAIGWMLPRDEIDQVMRRWPTVIGGTFVQYATMPMLAYAAASVFGFEGDTRLGIVIIGCVPGAMASNVLTLVARGNVSYSLSLTTMATLLAPLFVPVVLWIALGERVAIPGRSMFLTLCAMVVLPVLAGHALGRWRPDWSPWAKHFGPVIANVTILWIIAVVVGKNREGLQEVDSRLVIALLSINVGGYVAGTFGAMAFRLPSGMRRALTLEVGMQNAGLGSVLAANYFGDAAALPAALYTFGCMFTGTLLARMWSLRDPNAERAAATDSV